MKFGTLTAVGVLFVLAMALIGANSRAEFGTNWQEIKCRSPLPFNPEGGSWRIGYGFVGKQIFRTEVYFADDSCRTPIFTATYGGTMASGRARSQGVIPIDISYTNLVVSAANDGGRLLMNNAAFCGHVDWEVNRAVDLSQHGRDERCMIDPGVRTVHDIYGMLDGRLYFGKAAASDAVDRELDVDRDDPYESQ